MARYDYDDEHVTTTVPKKADIILRTEQEISNKQDEIVKQSIQTNSKLQEILGELESAREQSELLAKKNGEIKDSVGDGYTAVKQEIRYLAMQNEQVFRDLCERLQKLSEEIEAVKGDEIPATATGEIDYETLANKVAEKIPASEAAVAVAPIAADLDYDVLAEKVADRIPAAQGGSAVTVSAEIDYDLLADKVAERIPASEAAVAVAPVATEIDYDLLADKLAERMPASEAAVAVAPVAAEIDYDLLADKVAERMPAPQVVAGGVVASAPAEVDYDLIAEKVISRIPVQEAVSADYIASKVAEQLIIPEGKAQVDCDELAEKVAEKLPAQEAATSVAAEIDYDILAEKIASYLPEKEEVDCDYIASKVAGQIVIPEANTTVVAAAGSSDVDEDELADRIALKVGAIKAEDFDILVDDEGCNSISKEIIEKLDYDYIAAAVAEKLLPAIETEEEDSNEPDYEEMASRISEKITVAGVNEDAIAEKAAAVLSNYLPEFDTDEIADKVATQVISSLPEVSVDNEYLTTNISEKIIESQADHDYDIVLDDDGIKTVTEKVGEVNSERFDAIDREIAEIREMLENGVVAVREAAPAAEAYEDEPYTVEESLVTVSDLISDVEEEEVVEEEPVEEVVEEVVEEQPVEEVVEEVIEEQPVEEVVEEVVEEEPVEEVAEEAAEETEDEEEDVTVEEIVIDENGEVVSGVDFANMMRYNRSFIARIIQGTDEQKNYYGEVRNALLSYKKVNSNIAWGAERFHKGRETIARFKIRGKTLVVYLALDPTTHEYSVYHHKDESANKSVAGTPMMIKVKSPLGVKKAVRLIDEMLEARGGVKRPVPQRDYAAMYPYETMEELIDDGLVKDVRKDK